MEREDCNTKKSNYRHFSEAERYKLEGLLDGGMKVVGIVGMLGRDRSTVYREIARGTVELLGSGLRKKARYRANVAQARYEELGRNKERGLKIGKDKALEEHIREKILGEQYSPDAIIGKIKEQGLKFEGMICTKTLYNYIDRGIFAGISNEDLWEKNDKKRKHSGVARPSRKNRTGRSIEERPEDVEDRQEYGHWEGDLVKGPRGSSASLLTFTERHSREEIIIKLSSATQEAVKEALDGIEKKLGEGFSAKFRSITFDNGPEFLDWRSLEISCQGLEGNRTTVFFAHAYSAWERGTNENHNRMIRRFIPKGTDISLVDEEDIAKIQDWMNNYPRRILGYKTPNEVAVGCLGRVGS